MMEARVAGVPIPFPFRLSRSSSSCNSLPQCSIAERRLLSVCEGRGLVCFSTHSADCRGKDSPGCKGGKAAVPSSSSSRSFRTARHPADLTTVPFGGEHAVPRRERDGGNILEATGGEGFEQAGGYHVVHRALVGGQLAGQTLGDDERMVVGNFPRIHAAAVERSSFQGGRHGRRKLGTAPAGRCGRVSRRTHRPRGSGSRYGDSSTPSSRKATGRRRGSCPPRSRTCRSPLSARRSGHRAREVLGSPPCAVRRQPPPSPLRLQRRGRRLPPEGFRNAIQRWRRRACRPFPP
mgnify:CR=1 FL=1